MVIIGLGFLLFLPAMVPNSVAAKSIRLKTERGVYAILYKRVSTLIGNDACLSDNPVADIEKFFD